MKEKKSQGKNLATFFGDLPAISRSLFGLRKLQALQQARFQGLAEALGQLVLRPEVKNPKGQQFVL